MSVHLPRVCKCDICQCKSLVLPPRLVCLHCASDVHFEEYASSIGLKIDSNLEHLPEYASLHRDGKGWFVQSECFSYAAGGNTARDAIDNFWSGLIETVYLHLERVGNIEALVLANP